MTTTLCTGPLPSAYTKAQLEQYLQHVKFPLHLLSGPRDLKFLNVIHALQIIAIPYENLSLHYNPEHRNNIEPQALFQKFVTNNRGRGGYCMETAIFWREILRGLGFHTYTSAARIRLRVDGVPKGDFIGIRHVTNIVTVREGKYSSDVGFGGDGATIPLPLSTTVTPELGLQNLGSQYVRLVQAPFPSALVPEHNMVWQYQYRNRTEDDWNIYYAFPEAEAFDADFVILNYYTSQSPDSFQVQSPLVVKFLASQRGLDLMTETSEANGEQLREAKAGTGGHGWIVGKVMLAGNAVRRNMGGRTETLLVCTSEEARIQALEQYFGITLTREEQLGIKGFGSELRP